jgi:uncharacterized protein (DUF2267 family)
MATRSEEYVYKGKEFVNLVARQLQKPDDVTHAGQVTVTGLHALRDLLTPEESLHLISQLPLYLKAAFVDGWRIDEPHKIKNKKPFPSASDFDALFSVLKNYVSAGELDHVRAQLPEDLKPKC